MRFWLRILFILSSSALILVSCGGGRIHDTRLLMLDSLVESHPDSALAVISRIDALPQQVLEDGQYYIMANGKYLTDKDASTDRTGDFPVFAKEKDMINPQRQLWNIEFNNNTERYKISNVQDGRYVNERGSFWANREINPYNPEWHTYTILKTDKGYTIQCGGNAGTGYWTATPDRIQNAKESYEFQIVPVK